MYRGAINIQADAQVYCTRTYEHTDPPMRLMIYTLMSFFEAEM